MPKKPSLSKKSPLEDNLAEQLKSAYVDNPFGNSTMTYFVREFKFHPKRKFKADFAWPHKKLLVEVEGGTWLGSKGRHTSGKGFESDCEKYNLAAMEGYKVLRFTGKQVKNGTAVTMIKRVLS